MKNSLLKNKRKAIGMTQVQLAKRAEITEVNYQRIEYGIQRPSLMTAQLIARALGSTVEELFPIPK